MGIKKRLCNAPAEEVAGNGDPEIRGMFIGAGRASSVIQDLKIRREFEQKVVDVEANYIVSRKQLAEETRVAMDKIFHEVLDSVGPGGEELEKSSKER